MNKKLFATLPLVLVVLVCVLLSFSFLLAIPRKHFSEKYNIPNVIPENNASENLNPISTSNISNFQEIEVLPQNGVGMVVALAETPEYDIQAVYETGIYSRWDSDSSKVMAGKVVFTVQKGEKAPKQVLVNKLNAVVDFNENGSLLITPNRVSSDGSYGFNIWRPVTAELLDCSGDGERCVGDITHYSSLLLHPIRDLYFSLWKDSEWGSLGGWYGFINQKGKQGMFYIQQFNPEEPQIERVSIDSLGDYLAYVYDDNTIAITDVSRHQSPFPQEAAYGYSYIANYQISGDSFAENNTIDLKLDETHSWLGWLTDEKLIIWSLRNYMFPLYMNLDLKGANVMSFDRTGKILAVATQDGIKIFDLEEKKEIAEYLVGNVTALYFTRDNRLLVWGDAQGVVHLWGVK